MTLPSVDPRLAYRMALPEAWVRLPRETVAAVLAKARELGAPNVPDALEPDQVRAQGRPRLVEYYLPSPEGGPGLLFSFSMQAVPLFALLTDLFDAMVASVQWSQDGQTWR